MNQAIIAGHLGDDPRAIGDKGYSFRVATKEKGKDGADRTEWHSVTAWAWLAEQAATLSKGDAVMVIGRIETRQVQKQDGSTAYFTGIVANQLYRGATAKKASQPAITAPIDEHEDLGF